MNSIYMIVFTLTTFTEVVMLPTTTSRRNLRSATTRIFQADAGKENVDWLTVKERLLKFLKWKTPNTYLPNKFKDISKGLTETSNKDLIEFISKSICSKQDSKCNNVFYKVLKGYISNVSTRRLLHRRSINNNKDLHRIKHFATTYNELKNISSLLEPLLQEILKAEQNQSAFNSKYFDKMREKLDSYMHSIDAVETSSIHVSHKDASTIPTTKKSPEADVETTIVTETTSSQATNNDGFIVLGGGEDDEGGDDSDEGFVFTDTKYNNSGDDEGDDDDHTVDEYSSDGQYITSTLSPSSLLSPVTTSDDAMEEMGLVVVIDNTPKETFTTPPTSTTSTATEKLLPKHRLANNDTLDIDYHGSCTFCKSEETKEEKQKRKEFQKNILKYDFVYLAQKHPSGVFTTILSLRYRRIEFPVYTYINIHVPLTCDCFVKAQNIRYVLTGQINIDGELVLNTFSPLYSIENYEQVQEIQKVMEII